MRSTIAAAAAATLAGLSTAKTFDASAKTNVVTYWGQGAGQGSLLSYCQNPNIDVINIGFVNVFPDQGNAGWPGTNFGNACGSETYTYKNISTQLLSNCPDIGPDIALCQQIYGTKILLSIGGAGANGFNDNDDSGSNFARFLWGAFGPSLSEWTDANGPRPFGDSVVDGFDFDIESELSSAPVVNGTTITDYMTRGWAAMVNTFKNELFPKDGSKSYYLSAAPQCVVPDEHLSTVIANAWFDFLFVQFYNTAQCSARSALGSSSKRATGFTGYDNWVGANSFNPNVKIYMGLAASTDSATDPSYYIEPAGVSTLVGEVYSDSKFGGIMLWQASTEANNIICSKDYATWMKQILEARAEGTTINTETSPCPAQTVSPDGTCGMYNGFTCAGSIFGNCCSIYGYCGDTSEYCAAATCNTDGGDCGDEYVGVISSNSTSNASSSTTGSTTTASSTGTAASAGFSVISSSSAVYGNATAGAGFATNSADPALMTTSTVVSTNTQTISTTNAAGEPTVYVTEDVTSYTTVCPVTAAEGSATATGAATVNANYVPSTKTIYTTDVVTITSCAPEVTDCPARTESQTTVTVTSTYAVGTTLVYYQASPSGDEDTTTTTTTTTVRATSTITRIVVVSTSSEAGAVAQTTSSSALSSIFTAMSSSILSSSSSSSSSSSIASVASPVLNYAPYALSNSSSIAYPTATAAAPIVTSSSLVQVVTATIVPVQAKVSVVAAGNSSVSGVASSTLSYTYTPTSSGMPIYTGAAGRVEYGFGAAAALAVGALFAL